MIKVRKFSDKYDIFIVEEKRIFLIGNKAKISLEMNPRRRELVRGKTVEGVQYAD